MTSVDSGDFSVLLVSRDFPQTRRWSDRLRRSGCDVVRVASLARAQAALQASAHDYLLLVHGADHEELQVWLDALCPGFDGSVCVLSGGRLAPDQRVQLLEAGAGEVLEWPVEFREVELRILASARLRRRIRRNLKAATRVLRWAGLRLDEASRQLSTPAGQCQLLTRAERSLLAVLLQAEGGVVDRQQLLGVLFRQADVTNAQTLDTLVYRLRRKLKGLADSEVRVVTVSGVGFRLVAGANHG